MIISLPTPASTALHFIQGNLMSLPASSMFGVAPPALWRDRYILVDSLGSVPVTSQCLLAERLNGHHVLFDAGPGNFFSRSMRDDYGIIGDDNRLLRSLRNKGIVGPDQIDVVVLSHLHWDHAGGLLQPSFGGNELRLIYPDAHYVVSQQAFEQSLNPDPLDQKLFIPGLAQLLESSGRLTLVDSEGVSLSGEGISIPLLGEQVRFYFSHGHTPGQMHALITSDYGSMLFGGDLFPGRFWVQADQGMGSDQDQALLAREKMDLLSQIVAGGWYVHFYHDHVAVAAQVEELGPGFYAPKNIVHQSTSWPPELKVQSTPSADIASIMTIGKRSAQEDFVIVTTGNTVTLTATVADGHGFFGNLSQAGARQFAQSIDKIVTLAPERPADEALREAVQAAEGAMFDAVHEKRQGVPSELSSGIDGGTTLVAYVKLQGGPYIVNVGDSRAYHIASSQNEIRQITTDHDWSHNPGDLRQFEIAVSRALGDVSLKKKGLISAEPDIFPLEDLESGDYIILCSDGLHILNEEEIRQAVLGKSAEEAARGLLEAVIGRARDNVSIVVIKIKSPNDQNEGG